MNWYYAEQGNPTGPVEEAIFEELVRSGKIQPDTLVWQEGMANWQPYREVKPAAAPPTMGAPPVATDGVVCTECHGVFTPDTAIRYGDQWVCANCKPVFLQKLREGVATGRLRGRRPLPVDPETLVTEITERGYTVDIGSCVTRAWDLVKANLGLTIGATLLVVLCIQAGGFLPFIGAFISLILQGPLMGGLYAFYLKLIRGEAATVGDAFKGFSSGFGRLCGSFLLMIVLVYLCFAPAAVYAGATGMFSDQDPDAIVIILGVIGLLGAIYLGVTFVFALPLAADLELGPVDSLRVSYRIVTQHWFAVFGLMFVAGLVSALGVIACCIGVIFTMPLFYATAMYAYEDIFGSGPASPSA